MDSAQDLTSINTTPFSQPQTNELEGLAEQDPVLSHMSLSTPVGNQQAGTPGPYGPMRELAEPSPSPMKDNYLVSAIPRKDMESYLNNYRAHNGIELRKLRDPVLQSLYRMGKLAEQDGYRIKIESGFRDPRPGHDSFHYHGEGVDLNLVDAKGNYIPEDETVKKGIQYGYQAGFGSMIDEYNYPSSGATGKHLHYAWGNERVGAPGVHTFRRRDYNKPGYFDPFQGDDTAEREDIRQRATKGRDFIPTQVEVFAMAYGIDPSIASRQAKQESNFDPHIVSPAGAFGVMQLMPGTATEVGGRHGWTLEEIKANPSLQIKVGMEYMSDMLKRYKGNYAQALAAYNAGPGTVDKFLEGKGTLPPETQHYVHGILGDVEPSVKDVPSAVELVRSGGGMIQDPQAAQQYALDHLNRLGNAHKGLVGSMLSFGQDYLKSLQDPNHPGSILYQKGWIPVTADATKAGAADYAAGVTNAGLDFIQDIMSGLTMNIVKKPQRFREISQMGSDLTKSAASWTDTFLGLSTLGAGNVGHMMGGAAIGELAAIKLFGPGGIKALLGGSSEGGVLANTAVGGAMRNVLGLGGIAFTDGFVSSIADWAHGDLPEIKDVFHAIGHATAIGGFSASMGIATALFGPPLIQQGEMLGRSVLGVPGELASEISHSSPVRQAAIGSTLGVMGGIAGGAVGNMTGFNKAVFGGDVSVPDSAFLGMLGGGVGIPGSIALTNRAIAKMPPHVQAMIAEWGAKSGDNLRQVQGALGNSEAANRIVQQAIEQVHKKTNDYNIAVTNRQADLLDQHVEVLGKKVQMAQDVVTGAERDATQLVMSKGVVDQSIQDLQFRVPDLQNWEKVQALKTQAEEQYAKLSQAPPENPDTAKLQQQALKTLTTAQSMEKDMLQHPTTGPAIEQYRLLQQQRQQLEPQVQASQAKLASLKDEFGRFKMAYSVQSELASQHARLQRIAPQEWDPETGSYKKFVHDRAMALAQAPNEMATTWGIKSLVRDQEGNLTSLGEAQYRNYAEALAQELVNTRANPGETANALEILEGQALKAYGISPESDLLTYRPVGSDKALQHIGKMMEVPEGTKLVTTKSHDMLYQELQKSNIKWDLPDITGLKGDAKKKALAPLKNLDILNAPLMARMVQLEELAGTRPVTDPQGLLQYLGYSKPVPIPRVTSMEDFDRQVLPLVKLAQDAGVAQIPISAPKELMAQIRERYDWKKREPEFRAMTNQIHDTLKAQAKVLKSRPVEATGGPGKFTGYYDFSEAHNPDYIYQRIHDSQNDINTKARIAEALKNRDTRDLLQIQREHEQQWNQEIQDLGFITKQRAGEGRNNPASQAVVLNSSVNNARLGLEQDPAVQRNAGLDSALGMLQSSVSHDFVDVDRGTDEGFTEMLHSFNNDKLEGRSASDHKGMAGMVWGHDFINLVKSARYGVDYLMKGFRQVVEQDMKSVGTGKAQRDEFLRDMVEVMENPSRLASFQSKYKDTGKTTLYYANRLKALSEQINVGAPELENWMRSQVFPAFFPKYSQHFLDSLGTDGSKGLKTILRSEQVREFGSLDNLRKEMQKKVSLIEQKGHDPETFHNLPIHDRMSVLFDEKRMQFMSPAELEKAQPELYKKLVKEADRYSSAHLFTEFDADPVSVFDRQFTSMFRAMGLRRALTRLADIQVDLNEGKKSSTQMKGFVHILAENEKMLPSAGDRPYRLLSQIAGMDGFEVVVGGKTIPASRVAIHPDGFEFFAQTALGDGRFLSPKHPFWKSWDRAASAIRSFGLMGSIIPFLRHITMSSLSEMMLTPLRSAGLYSAGRNLLDGDNKDYRLAIMNSIRSGVNSRLMQQSTRSMMSSLTDAMSPEESRKFLGVAEPGVGRWLQALDRNDPSQKAAMDSLGGWSRLSAEVLGAPIAVDNVFNSEMLFKNIEAGMHAGFYYRRALYEKKYADALAKIPSAEARERALDAMASTVTNTQAGAVPQHLMSGKFAQAMRLGIMTPSWFMGKAHLIIDALDGVLGLGQRAVGVKNQDVAEIADLLKGVGVQRKYSGYSPEIKSAIRERMALTIGGGLFAAMAGTQALNYMINGTDTLTGNPPDKWFSVRIGDTFMSGLVPGHVRDITEGLITTGTPGKGPVQAIADLLNRNLMPLPKTAFQILTNQDDFGKQIGIWNPTLEGSQQYLQDLTGYMGKKFLNYEETLGYKPGTNVSDVAADMLNGPGSPSPNAISGKKYLLQSLGLFNSRDNTALTQKGDVQARVNQYKFRIQDIVRPYAQAANDEEDPVKRNQLLAKAMTLGQQGYSVTDPELRKFFPDGKVRMTQKEVMNMIERTFNPAAYTWKHSGHDAVGMAVKTELAEKLESREGLDTSTAPQDGAESETETE